MHWILQSNLFRETEWDTMVAALQRMDLPMSEHKVVPFVGELYPDIDLPGQQVICMGAYAMRHVAKRKGWDPGVYDLYDQTFEKQREMWGDWMLNADSVVTAFGEATMDGPSFIRPIDDSKFFAGRMISPDEMKDWQTKVCDLGEDFGDGLRAHTLIQVSPLKTIFAEYRYWVVGGEIVTKSLYKRGDKVIYSDVVDERFDVFVKQAIAQWEPHRAFVIDVCDTPQGIRIVEINTLNSAGFYAGDVVRLIEALEELEQTPAPDRSKRLDF